MQANFGTSVATLGSQQLPLAVASPIDGCSPLQNTASLAGAVVLIQRGALRGLLLPSSMRLPCMLG
jgi:hypothetical protein